MKKYILIAAAIVSFYSTETCRTNPEAACPTADGSSLYTLEARGVDFAASYKYPLGSHLNVCNLENGKCVNLVVKDRGPSRRLHRTLDLGKSSFRKIASLKSGTIKVRIKKIG